MRKSVNLKVGFGDVRAKELGSQNRGALIGCDDHFTLKNFFPFSLPLSKRPPSYKSGS
jgi:hypothetical protein